LGKIGTAKVGYSFNPCGKLSGKSAGGKTGWKNQSLNPTLKITEVNEGNEERNGCAQLRCRNVPEKKLQNLLRPIRYFV
jgi:hypothetical protein